jgi:hypothetical protein
MVQPHIVASSRGKRTGRVGALALDSPSVPHSGWKVALRGVIWPKRADPRELRQFLSCDAKIVEAFVANNGVGQVQALHRAGGATQNFGNLILETGVGQAEQFADLALAGLSG